MRFVQGHGPAPAAFFGTITARANLAATGGGSANALQELLK
jgi:hypothetical protein